MALGQLIDLTGLTLKGGVNGSSLRQRESVLTEEEGVQCAPQLLCGSGRSQMFPEWFVRGLRREPSYKARGLRQGTE